ncbi:MAG TPA: hypothetical protein VGB99_15405 [Acidobacteriota bacterium]
MRWFERGSDARLVAYLDATLSGSEQAALERDLKCRPELQRQLAELRRDLTDLAALPLPWPESDSEAADARFRSGVRRRLASSGAERCERGKLRTGRWLWVAVPAAVAATAALTMVLNPPRAVDPPPRTVHAPLPPAELGFESALAELSVEQLEQASIDLYGGALPDDAAAYAVGFAPSAEERLLELDAAALEHTLSELEALIDSTRRGSGSAT